MPPTGSNRGNVRANQHPSPPCATDALNALPRLSHSRQGLRHLRVRAATFPTMSALRRFGKMRGAQGQGAHGPDDDSPRCRLSFPPGNRRRPPASDQHPPVHRHSNSPGLIARSRSPEDSARDFCRIVSLYQTKEMTSGKSEKSRTSTRAGSCSALLLR